MRVFQINTVYNTGSTGRIVVQLKQAIEARGGECMIAYGRGEDVDDKNTYRITSKWDVYIHALLTRITDKTGFYSSKSTEKLCDIIKQFSPDIIHLHNLHGYYLNIEILFEFLKQYRKPIIWTLHDCWAFTGHCVYFTSANCNQWKTHCYKCVQKERYPASKWKDNCWENYERKKRAFTGISNMMIVTPSYWLESLVKESFLREYPTKVIHNGIDLEQFYPLKNEFRRKYHIENKFMLLGVANVWSDARKGYADFIELSKRLENDCCIVLVGLSDKELASLPQGIIGIKKTNNVRELAAVYSSADLFLNLTYEDNYPTVNLEAIACNTPVLTYDSGGSSESINKETGFVVKTGDLDAVIQCIKDYKENPNMFDKNKFDINSFHQKRSVAAYCLEYNFGGIGGGGRSRKAKGFFGRGQRTLKSLFPNGNVFDEYSSQRELIEWIENRRSTLNLCEEYYSIYENLTKKEESALVSVIIPFYHNAAWLDEAIESVIRQTYSNIQIVVVNDGSDENVEWIKKKYFKKIEYIYQSNSGAAHARNVGISAATGDYICFLDSDDLWGKNKVEKQLTYMKCWGYEWTSTYYKFFDQKGIKEKVRGHELEGKIFPLPLISCHIATPSVMIKRELLTENDDFRFEENLTTGEDNILWLKLSFEHELGVVPEVLVYVREHGTNAAKDVQRQLEFREYVWKSLKEKTGIWKNVRLSIWAVISYKLCSLRKLWMLINKNKYALFFFYSFVKVLCRIEKRIWVIKNQKYLKAQERS